jgi:hypothetical protein
MDVEALAAVALMRISWKKEIAKRFPLLLAAYDGDILQ